MAKKKSDKATKLSKRVRDTPATRGRGQKSRPLHGGRSAEAKAKEAELLTAVQDDLLKKVVHDRFGVLPLVDLVLELLPFQISRGTMVRELCTKYNVSSATIDAAISKAKEFYAEKANESRSARVGESMQFLQEVAIEAKEVGEYGHAVRAKLALHRLANDTAPDVVALGMVGSPEQMEAQVHAMQSLLDRAKKAETPPK